MTSIKGKMNTQLKQNFPFDNKTEGLEKWLWGEDITPYSVKWNEKYINYCDGIANLEEPKYFKEKDFGKRNTNQKYLLDIQKIKVIMSQIINIIKNKKECFELKLVGNFKFKTLLLSSQFF